MTRKLNPIFNYNEINTIVLGTGTLALPWSMEQLEHFDTSLYSSATTDCFIKPHIDDDNEWQGDLVQAAMFNNIEYLFLLINDIIGEFNDNRYSSLGEYINEHDNILGALTNHGTTVTNTTKNDILNHKKTRGYKLVSNISVQANATSVNTNISLSGTTLYTETTASEGYYVNTSITYPPLVWICNSTTKKPILYNNNNIIYGIASRQSGSPNNLIVTFYTINTIAGRTPVQIPASQSIDLYVPYYYKNITDQDLSETITLPIERIDFTTALATHTHQLTDIPSITATAAELNVLHSISSNVTTNKLNDLASINLAASRINDLLADISLSITSESFNQLMESPIANDVKGYNITSIVQPLARRGYKSSQYIKVNSLTLTSTSLNNPVYYRHATGSDDHVMILEPYSNTYGEGLIYTINPIGNNNNKIKFPNGSATNRTYNFKALIIPSARYFDTYVLPCGTRYYHNFGNTNYYVIAAYPDIDPDDLDPDQYPEKHLYVSEKTSTYCTVTSPSQNDISFFDPAIAIIDSSWIAENGTGTFDDTDGETITLTSSLHQTDPMHPELTSSKTIFIELIDDTTNMSNYWIEQISTYSFKVYSTGLDNKSFNWFVPKLLSEIEGTINGEIL